MEKFLRNDVADLLKNGLDSNAYGRVEQLYADQNLSSCYDFVEQSCLLILSHLSDMDKHRECPEECKEAIPTLMFAAARFADLPELRELRSLFAERFGNYLEPYVNQEFVKNMKADPPSKQIKLQMMQEIALDCGVPWDSKVLEQKLYKPPPFVQAWSKKDNERNNESRKPHHQNDLETNVQETEKKQNEVATKNHTLGNNLPYRPRAQVEKEENHKDQTVENGFPYKSTAKAEKLKEEKHGHGPVSPYWSSNSSSCSESTASPEYSTDPDDTASEDLVGRKFFGYRSMAPPYTKTDPTNKGKSSGPAREEEVARSEYKDGNLQSGSKHISPEERKFYGFSSMAPPYIKKDSTSKGKSAETEIAGPKCKDNNLQEPVNSTKPVPRSMRVRRPLKPVSSSHVNNEVPKPSPKFSNGENHDHDRDHGDEEEKKMENLSSRYGSREVPAPTRTGSLPPESLSTPVERKGLARAATYQPDSGLSPRAHHVHPKLPDYDDFVARLAALRASS